MAAAIVAAVIGGCGGAPAADTTCARGFVHGSSRSDGVYFAYVSRACGFAKPRTCTVGDVRGPIETEHVDAGVAQDCVAFSQFIGAGVGTGGECTGFADTSAGRPARRSYSRWRCVAPWKPNDRSGPSGLASPRPRSATIEARTPDPVGVPPGAYSSADRRVRAPAWSVLVWRAADGSVCHEAGQVIRGEQLRTYAAYYSGGPPRKGEIQDALGSLRPDAKFGAGRQYFHLGRFLPYPVAEGGSCGDPAAAAGILFSREYLAARPDLGPPRTIVEGIASARVVAATVGGRRLEPSSRGAFIAVFKGSRPPEDLPVVVTYRDGTERRFTG